MDYRLVALTVLYFSGYCHGEEAIDQKQCKRAVGKVAKQHLDLINSCIHTMEFKTRKERAAKLSCIMKCAAVKDKLLKPDATVDIETIDMYTQTNMPAFLHARGKKLRETCLALVQGENALDPEEEYCRTYTPLVKCFLDQVSKLCEEEKPKRR